MRKNHSKIVCIKLVHLSYFGVIPVLLFHFIYWFTLLVLSPSSFGFHSSLFHTLSFVFSPDPAPGCLPRSSIQLRLFSRPIVSVCFVFTYQLNVSKSFLFPSSHFAHTDSFFCFFPVIIRNFPVP